MTLRTEGRMKLKWGAQAGRFISYPKLGHFSLLSQVSGRT